MIYLDTNIVVWLAAHTLEQISQTAQDIIENSDELHVSPMVILELDYLQEVGRLNEGASAIMTYLGKQIGLSVCAKPFTHIIAEAHHLIWTRDPFDRIITAQAAIDNSILLTRDKTIRENYVHAIW